jgi:hypothetical protein
LVRAYSALPTRTCFASSNFTTSANTFSPQCLAEAPHARVFVVVTRAAEGRVVSILLATARIAPGGQLVTPRIGADPDILVSRRHGKPRDPVTRATAPL